MTPPSIVTVRRAGQRVIIDMVCEALTPVYTAMVVTPPQPQGGLATVLPQPLMTIRTDPPIVECWAGLAPVVCDVLTGAGHEIRYEGEGPAPLPPPDLRALPPREPMDVGLLEHIRWYDRLLIRSGDHPLAAVRIIRQIVMAWPGIRVLCLHGTVAAAEVVAGHLSASTRDVALVHSRRQYQGHGRVIVATPGSLGMIEIDRVDMVIVPDAIDGLRQTMRDRIRDAPRARLIGLLDRSVQPSPYERDMLTAMYGLHEVVVPRPEHLVRPVEVVTVPIAGGPALAASLDIVDLKRRGIWRHPVRNRKIVQLATALRTGDGLTRFPNLAQTIGQIGDRRVVILVETLDHGADLAQRLPDWPIVAGYDACRADLSSHVRRVMQTPDRVDALGPQFMIVTTTAAAEIRWDDVHVMIRADGGVGLPPLRLPGSLDVIWWRCRRLILIDFLDKHHPQLRRQSGARRRAYTAQGWYRAGADCDQMAVERFLAARPPIKGSDV